MRVFLTDLHFSANAAARLAAALPMGQDHRTGNLAATAGFHLVRYAIKQLCPDADTEHWLYGKNGKPRLTEGAPFFNLSHSRHGVAVAVSKSREVGIDLEEIRPHPFKFTQRYYTAQESEAVDRAPDKTSEIIRIWTTKEAAAKRIGTGIDSYFRNIPTDGVQNALVLIGERPHWLAVTPADGPVQIEWVSAEQLLSDI